MKIALTGGTGYVGTFIADRLLQAGHEVRLMVRPGGTKPRRALDTHEIALDPDANYRAFLSGADTLVHAAFHHQPGRYRHGEGDDLQGFQRANIAGSLTLLDQARQAGIDRAIVLSSRAVYGKRGPGIVLSEDMAIHPDTHYGAAKATLEAFASSHARQDGWPVCALRPTGVYGLADPIHRSKWFELVGDCLAGRNLPMRGGTEVHGADVAAAVMHLLQAPEADIAGKAFNCSDLYVSTRDIAAAVRERSGRDLALPDEPAGRAGFNVMECTGLKALGLTFCGSERLQLTIDMLTAHHLERGG
jgi:nucleoside-diphosphate-sugar epimerase